MSTADAEGSTAGNLGSADTWDPIRDYADQVTLQVRFKPWIGAEDSDETWLIRSDGAAWSRAWLARRLEDFAATGGGGCGGTGTYMLEEHSRKTEWGASGASYDFLLTLTENLASDAVWLAFGLFARELLARLRGSGRSGPAVDELTDQRRVDAAMWAVVRSRDVARSDLDVRSVADLGGGHTLVELRDQKTGVEYAVEVSLMSGLCLSRIRKITNP